MNKRVALAHVLVSCASASFTGCDSKSPSHNVSPVPAKGGIRFTDVTEHAGIQFKHVNGATGAFLLPEIMCGGAAFLDYDGDGLLDIYLVNAGELTGPDDLRVTNVLYHNEGNGHFVDVTHQAGVGDTGYGMGCAVGDYDNDGDVDLCVTNLGRNVLYQNNGDGTFRNVSSGAGVDKDGWSTSAAFVDIDQDGWLDLFITRYVAWEDRPSFTDHPCYAPGGAQDYCSPQSYAAPSFDVLYRNNGDGTFKDISESSGMTARAGTGLGVVCADLNGDDRVDIYVANDQMPSFAWINQGDGTFEERAQLMSCAVDETGKSQAGMGVDAADIDFDGDIDLWKVHLYRESHILYENQGQYFRDATISRGISAPTRRYTGFGTAFVDFDQDGLHDIFIANGRVQFVNVPTGSDELYAEPNQVLRQHADGRFEDVSDTAGKALQLVENSRAAAFGDFDNDGDVDVLIANCNGPARLLRNDTDSDGNWITIRLIDRHGRDAIGARISFAAGNTTRTCDVRSSYSYCAANDLRLHVGLGNEARISNVGIVWPDGTSSTHEAVDANQHVSISQPMRQ